MLEATQLLADLLTTGAFVILLTQVGGNIVWTPCRFQQEKAKRKGKLGATGWPFCRYILPFNPRALQVGSQYHQSVSVPQRAHI